MRTRADVVAAARSMIDTPFHHQGRAPGVGIDCIGLVVVSALMAGFDLSGIPSDYERTATDDRLMRVMDELLDRVEVSSLDETKPATVLVFAHSTRAIGGKVVSFPQHLRLRTDYGFIHCWSGAMGVCEHAIDPKWRDRFVAAYDFRGIEEDA